MWCCEGGTDGGRGQASSPEPQQPQASTSFANSYSFTVHHQFQAPRPDPAGIPFVSAKPQFIRVRVGDPGPLDGIILIIAGLCCAHGNSVIYSTSQVLSPFHSHYGSAPSRSRAGGRSHAGGYCNSSGSVAKPQYLHSLRSILRGQMSLSCHAALPPSVAAKGASKLLGIGISSPILLAADRAPE